MPRFAHEGGNGILSGDRKILARPHQLMAIQQNKLVGVFLNKDWANARRHEQAAHIIWWWPRIEDLFTQSKQSQCWQIPFEFGKTAHAMEVTPSFDKVAQKFLSRRKTD